ncbi:hypothetical protein BDY19DRAFT_269440 [Irpex rosettiformis]|uniref:Uncharacterized protein n=1 Tax=Irpex rosettiformis TaxID=378272 RepID=A0ACB8UH72_9APHY|nr:hypothetical protein BDY19DRAFT_269440 [Irpex rosettiformis]
MDTYADSIYSDESQASELLKAVLKPSAVAQPLVNSGAEYSLQDDYAFHDSPQASLSQYGLQNLPVSQSQVPGAPPAITSLTNQPSASWEPPGLTAFPKASSMEARAGQTSAVDQSLKGGSINKEYFAAITAKTGRDPGGSGPVEVAALPDGSQRTKAINNAQMPSPAPTPSPSPVRDRKRKINRSRRERSVSPVSDDSFGGPLPTDLQYKRHIANSTTFNLPLHELCETQDSSLDDKDPDELSTASTDDISHLPGVSGGRSYSSRFIVPSSEPSHSQCEEDSMLGEPAQVEEYHDDFIDEPVEEVSQVSSSVEAQAEMDALLVPSLPLETQVNASEPPVQPAVTSTGTSAAQSLISLIDPAKAHRYRAWLDRPQGRDLPRLAPSPWPGPTTATNNHGQSQPSSPSALAALGEETQLTSFANLPAQGHVTPPTNASQTSGSVDPDGGYTYEETQPSTASNDPPTNERIAQELQGSPMHRSLANKKGVFSNLANYSDSEVPDSEATQSQRLPNPTLSPIIPSPDLASPQRVKPSARYTLPPVRPKSTSKSPRKPQGVSEEIVPDSVVYETDATEEEVREVIEEVTKVAEKEEEEESSEEENVPLAKTVAARKLLSANVANGKRGRSHSQTLMPPPPKKEKATIPTSATKATRSHGPAINEDVSSSVALEKKEKPKVTRKPKRGESSIAAKAKGKGKATVTGKGKRRGRKAVAPKPKTPIRSHDDDSEEEEEREESNNAIAEDQRTELADDDDVMGVDDSLPAPGSSSRKRKRVVPASTARSTRSIRSSARAGGSTAKKLTRTTTTTPVARSTKRIKLESLAELKTSGATRVLALWRQDSYYYCGTVFSQTASGKYWIHFDDDSQDEVSIQHLRALDFQPGDSVTSIEGGGKGADFNASVISISCTVPGEECVVIDDGIYEEKEVEAWRLKVVWKSVDHEWEGRRLQGWQIDPYEKPPKASTPSVQSVTSSDTVGGNQKGRFLAKMGFAVSLTNGDGALERRNELNDMIKAHGGTVVPDWGEIFSMNGTCEIQGKRWVWRKDDVKLLKNGPGNGKFNQVFLLANDANQKPKFLIALALGIPCLDVEWLEDCVKENKRQRWQGYLLPTGSPIKLHTRVTQLVDYNWGHSKEDMGFIMDNPVAIKAFQGMRVLCVSPAFVETKKGSIVDVNDAESKRMIPRIILCMGASVVEAVSSLTFASRQEFEKDYDYLVIEPSTYPNVTNQVKQFKNWVSFKWVKECLMLNRLLPVMHDDDLDD